MSSADQFRTLVDDLKRRYGSDAKLGEALGITGGAMRRQVKATGTLGLEPLLRLALVSGRSPSEVLRIGGKPDYADLIESLYGPPRERPQGEAGKAIEILEQTPAVGGVALAAIQAAAELLRQRRDEDPHEPKVVRIDRAAKRGSRKRTSGRDDA